MAQTIKVTALVAGSDTGDFTIRSYNSSGTILDTGVTRDELLAGHEVTIADDEVNIVWVGSGASGSLCPNTSATASFFSTGAPIPVPQPVPQPVPVPAPVAPSPVPQPVPAPAPVAPTPVPQPVPAPVAPSPVPVPVPAPVAPVPAPTVTLYNVNLAVGSSFSGACSDWAGGERESFWLDDPSLSSATIICNTNDPTDLTAAKFCSNGFVAVDWDGSEIVDQDNCP